MRRARPDLEIDGELQADIAVILEELQGALSRSRGSRDAANVLVFPNLAAGNVAYKLMATLGGATAVGPILLGVHAPVTVLPRNAPVETIVNMTAFTVMKAQGLIGRRVVL